MNRVKFGDTECIRNNGAAGRTTTWSDSYALASGPIDKVGDHQEVARITHLVNDANFVLGLGQAIIWNRSPEAPVKPSENFFLKPRVFGLAGRYVESRHEFIFTLFEFDIAALGNRQGVVAGFWILFEKLAHLGG